MSFSSDCDHAAVREPIDSVSTNDNYSNPPHVPSKSCHDCIDHGNKRCGKQSTGSHDPARKAVLESISLLGSHVSKSVVEFLIEKIKNEQRALSANTSGQPYTLDLPNRLSKISHLTEQTILSCEDTERQPVVPVSQFSQSSSKDIQHQSKQEKKSKYSSNVSYLQSFLDEISLSSLGEDSDFSSFSDDADEDSDFSSFSDDTDTDSYDDFLSHTIDEKYLQNSKNNDDDLHDHNNEAFITKGMDMELPAQNEEAVLDELLCSDSEAFRGETKRYFFCEKTEALRPEPKKYFFCEKTESKKYDKMLEDLLCSDAEEFDDNSSSEDSSSNDSSSYEDFMDYCLPRQLPTHDSCKVTKLRHSRTLEALESDLGGYWTEGTAPGSFISVGGFISGGDGESKTQLSRSSNFHSTLHTSSICLVDISGFTKLSQCLELDALSMTINNFFQMIVEGIRVYGGDVLKFAGDALIAEWKGDANQSNNDEVVLRASMCAADIVNKCSDFPVVVHENLIATLNVHCAIGFGEVVGAHVNGGDRLEYLIFGDTIRQVADALKITEQGEVGASPEVLRWLSESVVWEENHNIRIESPQIIAYKSRRMFQCTKKDPIEALPTGNFINGVVSECKEWSMPALESLRKYLSKYVHPAVLDDNSSSLAQSQKNSNGNEKAKAELRDIFTVFIQPRTDFDFMGKDACRNEVIQLLNEIMQIVTAEVGYFKGQLRQFIVDDKGLVIIANFGLRGSTFPNMIEERAMPCLTNIKTLFKTELGIECKLGATYGKAYCGVVGGIERHEYAVLGPSVNLAARLMAHEENPGILVDEHVKVKASCHPFQSLPPVKAKGYSNPVKIFKPGSLTRKSWQEANQDFVGRQQELRQLSSLAQKTLIDGSSKMVLISAAYGYGKSSLLAHGVEQIESLCNGRSAKCFTTCHIFREEDNFQPFSIIRPILLQVLARKEKRIWSTRKIGHSSNIDASEEIDEAKLYVTLLQICMEAKIPLRYVEIFGGLTFTSKLSDIGKWSDRNRMMSEWNTIVEVFVDVILHFSKHDDLVLLALDDVCGMDEMSWKILELLYERAKNVFMVSACRNKFDMNMHPEFRERLEDDIEIERFTSIRLGPLDEDDITKLCSKVLGINDEKITRIAHIQSDGNPFMALAILEKMYMDNNKRFCSQNNTTKDFGNVEELLLNRLDSFCPSVRLHLNLGAMLGFTFELDDLVDLVAELDGYHKVEQEEEKASYIESVHMSMCEAVQQGILDFKGESSFIFTHQFWLDNILKLTLDSWKEDVITLFQNQSRLLTSRLGQKLEQSLKRETLSVF